MAGVLDPGRLGGLNREVRDPSLFSLIPAGAFDEFKRRRQRDVANGGDGEAEPALADVIAAAEAATDDDEHAPRTQTPPPAPRTRPPPPPPLRT